MEVFIWLLLLFLVAGGLMFTKYNYKKQFNTYQIFLPDVDGLISGSPVRFMGIQIGYVNQLDIVGEDVYVRFVVTDSKVRIPRGTTATVEFSGLGGSKSLELYPPGIKNNYQNNKFINIQSPKRIHDSASLLNKMFERIAEIAYKVSSFMDEVGIINAERVYNIDSNTKTVNEALDNSNKWLDKVKSQSDNFGQKLDKLEEKRKNGKNRIENSDRVE